MSDTIQQILLFTVLPVSLMLLLERLTLNRLANSAKGKRWVQSTKWMHPNFISRCRYPTGVLSAAIFHMGGILTPETAGSLWHHAAIIFFAFWIISDMTDGTIARHFDLGSEEGESIDPLSDKLLLFPPLLYFAYYGLIPMIPVLIFLVLDTVGQFSRYFITNKAANLFGKAKTFLAVITLIMVTIQQVYYPEGEWRIYKVSLYGAIILAFCSTFFKIIPNYWYANILSILNLICGISGIVLIIFFNQLVLAFGLVFLGQFLDMFDGRAAERWGSTPRGEVLDDLADGTNFGGTISLLIYYVLDNSMWGALLGLIYFVATAYRLYRFLIHKRREKAEGGMTVFEGMPAPAGALLVGTTALLNLHQGVKMGFILVISALMVSKLPYIHFGRVILPAIPKIVKVVLLVFILLALWIGLQPGNLQILFWSIHLSAMVYLLLGCNWKMLKHSLIKS